MMVFFSLGLYVCAVCMLGAALFVPAWLLYSLRGFLLPIVSPFCVFVWCCLLAGSYFLFGFALVLIAGALRKILGLQLTEGEHAVGSPESLRWYTANAIQYLVSVTFLDFLLLTPFAGLFLRLMGAKVGRNVQVNSKYCADYSLLEIGDGTVIGGHATVIGHSFERGKLILRKVKIGKKVVIGLNSVVLPGAEIGDGAVIAAGAVLGKDARVEPGAVYAGVPAVRVR